jgi:hypothetical protein
MKKIIVIAFVSLLTSCSSLMMPVVKTTDLAKTKIIENLSENKSDLYVKANKWMIKSFNNAESVIQFSDKESGTISGKYLLFGSISPGLYGASIDSRIFATINVECKNNKAKIEVVPLGEIRATEDAKQKMTTEIASLINDFETSIQQQKEDW